MSPSRSENVPLHPEWKPSAIDAAQYWKLLYERTARYQTENLGKIFELEQKMQNLTQMDANLVASDKKRSAEEMDKKSSKKRKTTGVAINLPPRLPFEIQPEDNAHAG